MLTLMLLYQNCELLQLYLRYSIYSIYLIWQIKLTKSNARQVWHNQISLWRRMSGSCQVNIIISSLQIWQFAIKTSDLRCDLRSPTTKTNRQPSKWVSEAARHVCPNRLSNSWSLERKRWQSTCPGRSSMTSGCGSWGLHPAPNGNHLFHNTRAITAHLPALLEALYDNGDKEMTREIPMPSRPLITQGLCQKGNAVITDLLTEKLTRPRNGLTTQSS